MSKASLSEGTSDFWHRDVIKVLDNPTPLEFMREAVSSYEPCILQNTIAHWPAMNMDFDDFCSPTSDELVKVNITPNGWGDAINTIEGADYFIFPAEVSIPMKLFSSMMLNRQIDDCVPYLSQQNDNLRTHFPAFLQFIDKSLPVADAAFNVGPPEAVNLWIGDERSTSSLHKDHFENMYCVLMGEKTFTLYPPTDVAFLLEEEHPTARYVVHSSENEALSTSSADSSVACDDAGVTLSQENHISRDQITHTTEGCPVESLSWVSNNPVASMKQNVDKNPDYALAHPVHVTVKAGEVLYIPSMWYHQVSQNQLTVAVNYWYEQRFDFRYVFYELAKSLKTT